MAIETRQKRRYLSPETLQKIGSLELAAREVVEGLRVGVHKSPLRGFSTEFAHHRQYVPGDAIRHMDWRVYARTERYYIKLYDAETNFDAHLLLDASSSMHYASGSISKLEYAKYVAASLAYLVVHQRDSVGLAVFDSELRTYIPPKSTLGIIGNIARELESVEGKPKTSIGPILHDFAHRIPRRGFVILISDLFETTEEFLKGLDHLRFCGHNVVVFHVMDPYELSFPFDGMRRFNGLENDGQIITQPKRIREAYLNEVRKFLTKVKDACERSRVDYVLVDTSKPVDVMLSSYLIGRIRGKV
jgi:uncharacterized protein (DUF58 family)